MDKDDIIRMARETGLHLATDVNWMPIIGLEYAEKFAALVAAHEREKPVQVSPLEFVTAVLEKEHLVGKPLMWAQWPNENVPGEVDIAAHTDVVRTSAENLARIREILKPTITELANLFGVSRQAVYDWQAGKPLAQENAAKLDDLAKAADALAATGIDGSSQLLRRKIAGSKSLLDVVREGGSATSAAQVLAQTLVREAKQRERLALRLAGRAKPNVPHDDYGDKLREKNGG